MSNLIPLHLDKQTGSVVAKYHGQSNLPPNTVVTYGYTHIQTLPVTSWLIHHNVHTDNLVVQVYDTTNQLVIPDTVIVNNIDNITITFAEAFAGKAQLVLFAQA